MWGDHEIDVLRFGVVKTWEKGRRGRGNGRGGGV